MTNIQRKKKQSNKQRQIDIEQTDKERCVTDTQTVGKAKRQDRKMTLIPTQTETNH